MIRRGLMGALVIGAALVAGKKDVILAKLRGASPEVASALDSTPAKEMLERVTRAAGKQSGEQPPAKPGELTLPGLRKALKTTIDGQRDEDPAPDPPAGVLEKVMYDAPLGKNVAYVTPVQ